jgi:death-on-curing protein
MIKYLSLEDIIDLHDHLIENFGGLRGIRDNNLLLSCIEIPRQAFGGKELYPSMYDKAACYLFHIVKNHPFNDANKRTGFSSSLLFLKANKTKITFKNVEAEEIVMEVAKGKIDKLDVAKFFELGREPIEY